MSGWMNTPGYDERRIAGKPLHLVAENRSRCGIRRRQWVMDLFNESKCRHCVRIEGRRLVDGWGGLNMSGRRLIDVHERILAEIPDPGLREALRKQTEAARASSLYAAPEIMPQVWWEYAIALVTVLGEDDERRPWIAAVKRVFAGGTA